MKSEISIINLEYENVYQNISQKLSSSVWNNRAVQYSRKCRLNSIIKQRDI